MKIVNWNINSANSIPANRRVQISTLLKDHKADFDAIVLPEMPLPSKCDFAKEIESILSEFDPFYPTKRRTKLAQIGVFVRPDLGFEQIKIDVPDMQEISVFVGKDDFVLGSVFCAERKNAGRGQLVEHNACWRQWLNSDASQALRANRTILTAAHNRQVRLDTID